MHIRLLLILVVSCISIVNSTSIKCKFCRKKRSVSQEGDESLLQKKEVDNTAQSLNETGKDKSVPDLALSKEENLGNLTSVSQEGDKSQLEKKEVDNTTHSLNETGKDKKVPDLALSKETGLGGLKSVSQEGDESMLNVSSNVFKNTVNDMVNVVEELQRKLRRVIRDKYTQLRRILQDMRKTERKTKEFEKKTFKTISVLTTRNKIFNSEQRKLIVKGTTMSTILSNLETKTHCEKAKLNVAKEENSKLKFILRLLREELQLHSNRRQNGYDNICFAFLRKSTAKRQRDEEDMGELSVRGIKADTRIVISHQQKLNELELKLIQAQLELHYSKQRRQHEIILLNSKVKKLKEHEMNSEIFTADLKKSIAKMTDEMVHLKLEESSYLQENEKVSAENAYLSKEVIKIRQELSGFKHVADCYKKLTCNDCT